MNLLGRVQVLAIFEHLYRSAISAAGETAKETCNADGLLSCTSVSFELLFTHGSRIVVSCATLVWTLTETHSVPALIFRSSVFVNTGQVTNMVPISNSSE